LALAACIQRSNVVFDTPNNCRTCCLLMNLSMGLSSRCETGAPISLLQRASQGRCGSSICLDQFANFPNGTYPHPRVPWLWSELCCLDPSPPHTTPCTSLAGTLRLHDSSLIGNLPCCGNAEATCETCPPLTAVLSMYAADSIPVLHRAFPLSLHGAAGIVHVAYRVYG
jgi:hypothetical protein